VPRTERTISGVAIALLCAAMLWPAQSAWADFTQQGPKLVGSDAVGNAEQGFSVALSGDGNTAIVGGPLDHAGSGAAWVFIRSGETWSQQAKLVGSDDFGPSVALSADGNTAIVGAALDNGEAGAAWVFTRSGGVWSQQAKLVGSGAIGTANQGLSVALSADGNTAIVGGPEDNFSVSAGGSVGAAWVFTRSSGTWSQQGDKLVGTGAVGSARQGTSVALSGDGDTAIVGGPNDNISAGSSAGAAWVFTRSSGMWSQQAKLVGSSAVGNARQGVSVALSGDGNTAIVGGPRDDPPPPPPFNGPCGAGAAWVFTRSGGTWSQQAKLVGSGAVGKACQGIVALSAGGNAAIVGGGSDNSGVGAAWVFTRSSGVWTQQGSKLVGSGGRTQGNSVALSCSTALVGGPGDNSNAGAAWAFAAPPTGTHDANGDCLSDIVWYDPTSGQVVIWFVNGTDVTGGGSPGEAGSPWAIVGQRDFNGDGRSDILWRDGSSGQLLIWFLNGSTVIDGGSPGSAASPWIVAGTGDFNGDGYGDVLWFNPSTGQAVIWLLNGATVIGGGSPGSVTDIYWTIAGTGDFNGDGMSDILWYNSSTGQTVIWLLNGTSVIGGGSPGSAASPWSVAGTGDFNGDGMSDILWYNTSTGQVVIWLLNGANVIGGGSPGSAANPWTIVQTGDFNHDSRSDILWYDSTSGQLLVWFIDGTSVIGGGSPGAATSPWQIQSMNAD
jgi:hypothetical protein